MTYSIRIYCTRMCIALLAGVGMTGLLKEIVPVSPEMVGNSLIVFVAILGVLTTVGVNEILKFMYVDMINAQKKHERERYYRSYPEHRESTRFEKRMSIIMKIADTNMKKAQYGGHFPIVENVMVKWEDLLKIWNLAELAKSETPVED